MHRFGFDFDAVTRVYYNDENSPHDIDYPNFDFFISLDESYHIFLRKNIDGRFIRILEYPVLKFIYRVSGNLIRTAEPI